MHAHAVLLSGANGASEANDVAARNARATAQTRHDEVGQDGH
jgi:hypothetical protein